MTDLFGNEKIRTLGLYQPFATLMLHGKVETRWVETGRKPPFPLGKYLIYSCQKEYDMDLIDQLAGKYTNEIDRLIDENLNSNNCWLVGEAGAIGDMVKIIDPLLPSMDLKTFVDDGWRKVDCKAGKTYRRVGLVFENMKAIKPFSFSGKQGIGFLKEEQRKLIKFI